MPGTRLRACRARKLLQKKEEQKAADKAAGIDLPSDYSDDESLVKCNWFLYDLSKLRYSIYRQVLVTWPGLSDI